LNEMSKTRTCLGCEGTGRDEAERRRQHIEHSRKFGWAGIPRYMVPALPMAPPCPACLGSGIVTEPDSRKDAMVDAETFYRVTSGSARTQPLAEWAFLANSAASYYERNVADVSYVNARFAHRAALRAVPSLKEA
jgi:hypothetical protein